MAVFYRQDIEKPVLSDKNDALKETTQARLDALQKELEWAKDIEQKRRIREEILSIKREFNRSKQYGNVMNMKLAEGKNSLDAISAWDLMRIDKESKLRRGEFLSKSFLYKRTTDKEGNIFEEPSDGKDLKEWDTLFVDFGKNGSAESKIGIGDLLSIDIKVVKVIDRQGNVRIGKRSIQGNKVGYYDENGYIPVYNNYTVQIPNQKESEDYLKSSNPSITLSNDETEENKAKDAFIETADRYEQFWEGFAPWNILEKQKFQKEATELAKKIEAQYGIPWLVTYGQATLETGYGRSAPNNNYFWIKGNSGWTFKTTEIIDGKEVQTNASFRGYSSMEESFEDYARLLSTNSRYQNAFQYKDNPELFLQTIIEAWYATDTTYVEKIKKIWGNYDRIQSFKIETPEIIGKTTPDELINQAQKYLWTEYNWWGNSEYGIDCSHLVCKSLSDTGAATKSFYRVAAWLRDITPIKPLQDIQKGDLIFWHGWSRWVSHVAIATWPVEGGQVRIVDASGKERWLWKVAERTIPLSSKLSAGTPPFYS